MFDRIKRYMGYNEEINMPQMYDDFRRKVY
jgi:hypothetical protein